MRRKLALGLAFVALATLPAAAERSYEVIHFTNGTTMTVFSHTVKDGMVHAKVGDDGMIAFPESMVERIVAAGKDVYLGATLSKVTKSGPLGGGSVGSSGGGQALGGSSLSYGASAHRGARKGRNGSFADNSVQSGRAFNGARNTGRNQFGVAVTYPFAANTNPKLREVSVAAMPGAPASGQSLTGQHLGTSASGLGGVVPLSDSPQHTPHRTANGVPITDMRPDPGGLNPKAIQSLLKAAQEQRNQDGSPNNNN